MTSIAPARLAALATDLLVAVGVPLEDAAMGAGVLVTADLRGVDTHGVSGLLPKYLEWYERGEIKADPRWRIITETPSSANIDADRGLGIVLAPRAMELAISKASDTGVGIVTVTGGRHLGACGCHAALALPHDMIGICMTASPPIMVPPGGREAMVGTNPIAVAAPAALHPPFLFDGAMTVSAGHRISRARREGADVPAGLVADDEGRPVMIDSPAPGPLRLLPLGSTPEGGSHKGFALAMVVEILAGVLSGSGFAARLGFDVANHMLMAIDIASFRDPEEFKAEMDEYLTALEGSPTAAGSAGVHVPGTGAWQTERLRRTTGIPIDGETLSWLRHTCERLGVSLEGRLDGLPGGDPAGV